MHLGTATCDDKPVSQQASPLYTQIAKACSLVRQNGARLVQKDITSKEWGCFIRVTAYNRAKWALMTSPKIAFPVEALLLHSSCPCSQGCKMVYWYTKNTYLGAYHISGP
jgi:hypothetical protein